MCKTPFRALTFIAAGLLLASLSPAQQSSAPTTNPPAASGTGSAAPKTQSSSSTKSGTTAKKTTPAQPALNTEKEKASYAIGMNIGKNLADNMKKQDVEVNKDLLLRGLKDGLSGNKPLMTDEEAQAVLTSFQKHVHEEKVAKNTNEGNAFLAANKGKPGVVTLPSGLQYKVITEGNGPKPSVSDAVICNYKGTLIDGTEFDSSYKRGKPATIPVGRVIKGWTEALQLMPVGSTWQLFIPPSLAYGEEGTNGGPIGPAETLVFEVQLLSILPRTAPAARPAPGGQPNAGQPNGAQPNAEQPKPNTQQPASEPAQQTPPPTPTPKPE
jgi:FKBP-type peptidyl-prolyl cis-trans isomerase FklB